MNADDPEPLVALARLDAQLDLLLASIGDLTDLAPEQLVGFATGFERLRRRLSLVDHRIVQALESAEVPARHGVRSTERFLARSLRIVHGEARQRVAAAHDLQVRLTPTGERLAVRRPLLAAAQRDGEVSPDQVQVILRGLDRVDHLVQLGHGPSGSLTEFSTDVEHTLVEHARTFDPTELRRCVERVVECLDPDGVLADDHAQQTLREVHLVARRDGMYTLRGVLTPQAGASLSAVLIPLAAQRPVCAAEGAIIGSDDRDHGARLHDALDEASRRLLRSGSLPVSGGVPATVLITVDAADLQADRGFGRAADGTLVPVRTLTAWADEADVITVTTSSTGEVLELGRQKRFATRNQTLALIARDGACTFPGCDHPPQWCDHHHVVGWRDGGATDVANLTLLCRYHHHRFERLGWDCRMIDGLPHWIPPRWADPEQRPILNQRLRSRRAPVLGASPVVVPGAGSPVVVPAAGSVGVPAPVLGRARVLEPVG